MGIDHQIDAYIKSRRRRMIELLEELVVIQSGTANKSGVDKVADVIIREMTGIGFDCERIPQTRAGDHIVARSPGHNSDDKQILMIGHMDTVFPADTSFNYFKEDSKNCYGPGVADMKGGLLVGIYALKALWDVNRFNNTPITFIFNSDEETGSGTSRELIASEAEKSLAAFVFEAGGLNNEVVTGRKGNFSAELSIEGKAGHAAFAGTDKASAILEMAHKIIAIEELNAPDKGVSANAGTVTGGIGSNTVAQRSKARLDFRFLSKQDHSRLHSRVEKIAAQTVIPGTRSKLRIVSSRPAMPQTTGNQNLFQWMKSIGDSMGIHISQELRQGVSDANLVADAGIPVLDGLGPIGAKDHSEDEYILSQSLFDRTILFSRFLEDVLLNPDKILME